MNRQQSQWGWAVYDYKTDTYISDNYYGLSDNMFDAMLMAYEQAMSLASVSDTYEAVYIERTARGESNNGKD